MESSRRKFLQQAGTSLGALSLAAVGGSTSKAAAAARDAGKRQSDQPVGLPKNWRTMRKFDAHTHISIASAPRPNVDWSRAENLIEAARKLGIEKLCSSHPVTAGALADIEVVRAANDAVIAAMKRYPGTVVGQCFVQPGNGAAALDEIERCLDAGMIGIKLYNQFKFSDPAIYPIAERCIQRGIPFLGHSAHLTDPKTLALQPKTSDSHDFCALSRRYPELLLILGHVNGGGDWEWAIKGLRDCPNVYIDTSGSVLEAPTIEMCVRELGHRRVLFATDTTMEGCVGKILSADLTPEQREDIFWRNLQRIFDRRRA
jgi:predicted TIM-barrel fold metal-dependent hydrolase